MKFLKKYLPLLICLFCFISIFEIDREVGVLLLGEESDLIYKTMKVITSLFNPLNITIITLVCVGIALLLKKKFLAYQLGLASLANAGLNFLIKILFKRPRPIYRLIDEHGYSFPSGHSSQAACFFASIFLAMIFYDKFKAKKNLLALGMGIMVALVGISRIYFGVHYLTDVIAGWSLGFAVSIITNKILLIKRAKA